MKRGRSAIPGYLGLAALVLALIVLFNRSRNRYLRMSSDFIGLGTGYLISLVGRNDRFCVGTALRRGSTCPFRSNTAWHSICRPSLPLP